MLYLKQLKIYLIFGADKKGETDKVVKFID
jgi:hypothetical protein